MRIAQGWPNAQELNLMEANDSGDGGVDGKLELSPKMMDEEGIVGMVRRSSSVAVPTAVRVDGLSFGR